MASQDDEHEGAPVDEGAGNDGGEKEPTEAPVNEGAEAGAPVDEGAEVGAAGEVAGGEETAEAPHRSRWPKAAVSRVTSRPIFCIVIPYI